MAPHSSTPNESERRAFVDKMGQFRASLAPNEQRMLDALVTRAMAGSEHDVQGYGLRDQLAALIEEWLDAPVPVDEEGRPLTYLTPWA
jgi:hypothetical protein